MSGRGKLEALYSEKNAEYCQRLLGKDSRPLTSNLSRAVLAFDPKDGWIENLLVNLYTFFYIITIRSIIGIANILLCFDF